MIVKFLFYFFLLSFIIWGILYAGQELIKEPKALKKFLKVVGIATMIGMSASWVLFAFVALF